MALKEEKIMARVAAVSEEEPMDEEKHLIKEIESNADTETFSLDEVKAACEYSGKISLRVPKSLHKELVEQARIEGVSLNQYALYKLSH